MAAVLRSFSLRRGRRKSCGLVWDGSARPATFIRAVPDVTFGAVSQHLGVLEAAGLVARREEGRFRYYAARRRELGHLGKWLESMWDEALADLKRHAESEERGAPPAPSHAQKGSAVMTELTGDPGPPDHHLRAARDGLCLLHRLGAVREMVGARAPHRSAAGRRGLHPLSQRRHGEGRGSS